jgi:hypothetical protein
LLKEKSPGRHHFSVQNFDFIINIRILYVITPRLSHKNWTKEHCRTALTHTLPDIAQKPFPTATGLIPRDYLAAAIRGAVFCGCRSIAHTQKPEETAAC